MKSYERLGLKLVDAAKSAAPLLLRAV